MNPRLTCIVSRSRLAALIVAISIALACPLRLSAQTTGAVTGQISNAATEVYLEGAVVEVEGTARRAFTDRQGRFLLSGLPAGPATLRVSYTGLDVQQSNVTVTPGQTIVRNLELTSGIYQMEKVTVAGLREGSALAVTLQRQAPNVKNVVSSDTFGNVADGNIGDFLQRLPGITAVYVGADVRQVQIRGINPDLNSVTMDGQRVASAQSGNLGRAFEFEQASLGLIETIEVTKAPTPDMDGDSVGGNVNLVTKSAFDSVDPRSFRYTVGGVYRPKYNVGDAHWSRQPIGTLGPSMNMTYSDVIGPKRNIGLLLTGTYHSQPGGGTASLLDYQRTAEPGPAYIWRARVPRPAGAPRTRLATGLKLDYKWSESTTFSFNSFYNWFHENNDTRTMQLQTAVNGSSIVAGSDTFFSEARPHNNTLSQISITVNDKSGRTYQFQPSARHRFDGLDIDYNLTYSNSATYYDHSQLDSHFNSRPRGVVTMRLRNIGWSVDRREDPRWPTINQTAGRDMYDLNNYADPTLQQPDRRGYDSIWGGRFNLRKDLNLVRPAFVKTGFNHREQSRETWRNSRQYAYVGPDGIANSGDEAMAQFLDTTGRHGENSTFKGYRSPPWPNPYGMARHQKEFPELWKEDITFGTVQRLQHRREITESVTAAYLMGSMDLNPFNVLAGVRYEGTKTDGEGPLQYISPAERARRAAWQGPLTDAEARRRAEAEWGGRDTGSGSYRHFFPGVHFKYEPFRGMVTRLSWSTGIGRPAFGSIIPLTNANDENETVAITNTGLKAQYSNNFDFSLEYYFEPVGLVSVGLFRKDIDDFIFTDRGRTVPGGADNGFDGLYEGYTIITTANGGSAEVQGLEFNYQQQMSFLPGRLRGLSVFANYTYLETSGDYGTPGPRSTEEIAGFLPRAGNVGLNYKGGGWDVRLQMNWRGTYLLTYSGDRSLLRYSEPRTTYNIKTKHTFSSRLALFFDVENIFSEDNSRTYFLYEDRIAETRTLAPKVVAGIQGRF